MATKTCLVWFTDPSGIRHSVELEAESLYEAAALGLRALKGHAWTEALGPATRLTVEVREPAIQHVVSVQQIQRWADSTAKSPAERIKKNQVKALLGSGSASSLD